MNQEESMNKKESISKEESRLISDILKILSIKSFTNDKRGIKKCQKLLVKMAKEMGFKATYHGNGMVLVIEPYKQKKRETPKIGIVVHIDTVPYDERNWKFNPLGEISDSIIYGRGVIDDKGPTIIAMHALYNISLEKPLRDSWQIIIGSSEEDEWVDMKNFLNEKPKNLPKFLIAIDGDGIQNGCRGYADLTLSFKRESDKTVIKDFYVPNGMNNTVPAECIAIIGDLKIIGKGREVHSSIPEFGYSAIIDLAKNIGWNYVDAYAEYSSMFDFLLDLDTYQEESIIGLKNDKMGGDSSFAVTNAIMEKDYIKINLNLRLGPGKTSLDVENVATYLKNKYGCDAKIRKCIEPSFIDTNQEEFFILSDSYQEVIGKKPNITIAKGLGYNAALPNCAIFGPRFEVEDDDEDSCHQVDEHRNISSILKYYNMLKIFLRKSL